MIYESSNPEKALEYSILAAHISPRDADQWSHLACLSLEAGHIKQAITCYTKAIQSNPIELSLYEARADLYLKMGDIKSWRKGYLKLITQLGPNESDNLIKYAKMLTKQFATEQNWSQALQSMEQIFIKCPHLVTIQEVHSMAELLLINKQFARCLDILTKFTEISIKYKNLSTTDPNKIEIEHCIVPDFIKADLKAKVMVALIELGFIELADEFSANFLADKETDVDLFLDVAEAFMTKNEYYRALKFFPPLINDKVFVDLAGVWLRYAECWVGIKELKKAILCYEIVTNLSPEHPDARLQLSTLYKCFKQYDLAVKILKQNPNTENIDPRLVYQRAMIFYNMENYDEFLKCGLLLISRHCVTLRTKSELDALMKSSVKQRIEALHLHRLTRAEPLEDENKPNFSLNAEINLKDEFKLFLKMCEITCKFKKYGVLERLCFTALTSKRFESKTSHIIFLCLLACIYNNNSFYAYNLVRELVRDCRKSNLWNLLDIVIQKGDDSRHNRFLMRLLSREDAFSYRHILNANNCLVSGTYKYALNDYAFLFRVEPSALLGLLIAVTFLQMACQKFAAKKHRLVSQGKH